MTAIPPSCLRIVAPALIASALFIAAIIVENFWMSMAFGMGGMIALGYGVFVLREERKRMTNDQNGNRRRSTRK
jgi:hypothetical protein